MYYLLLIFKGGGGKNKKRIGGIDKTPKNLVQRVQLIKKENE